MNLRIVSAISRKDVIDAIRHRYLLTALVTPLFVAILFRVMLPSMGEGVVFTMLVHDAGGSGLVAELRNTQQVKIVETASPDSFETELQKHKAIGGMAVPQNFDSDLRAGKQPELRIYVNNERSVFEQAAFRRLVNQMVRAFAQQPEPATLVWVDVAKKPNDLRDSKTNINQIMLPLLLILALGMTGAFVVPLLIVEEKEKYTLDFLLSSPASLNEIIAGKALTGGVYTLLIAGVLLAINRQYIQNWPLTILTIVLGLLFVVGVGLVVGSLLSNTMQVNTWASIVLLVLLAPSFPSFGLTAWFDKAMRFIPTYYLTEGLKLSMTGVVSSRLWICLAVLAGCTLLVYFAAAWALHRRS
jgi:ABC-2 type transport system permease protein